ncbi:hypothetical protein ACIGBN_08505 [Marinomonas sp. NPDC078689]|uniref:hypothetical protein n=1 Tax=Marinomonas sp. NPDC078689 TaxID=3364147 RepID=UPI0037CC74C9
MFSLVLSFTLASANASCKLPPRLLKDLIVEDILAFVAGKSSGAKSFLEKEGYESYDDFSYMNDSYSEAIVSLIEQSKIFGASYYNLIKGESNINKKAVKKAAMKILTECDKTEVKDFLPREMMKALKGKNFLIESELMEISVRLKYKYQH